MKVGGCDVVKWACDQELHLRTKFTTENVNWCVWGRKITYKTTGSELIVSTGEWDISTVIDAPMKMSTQCSGGVRKANTILVIIRKIMEENVAMLSWCSPTSQQSRAGNTPKAAQKITICISVTFFFLRTISHKFKKLRQSVPYPEHDPFFKQGLRFSFLVVGRFGSVSKCSFK